MRGKSYWSLFAAMLLCLQVEGASFRRLGKAMDGPNDLPRSPGAFKAAVASFSPEERPPMLYIRPMRDFEGIPIEFNNEVAISDNDTLPDFRKPLRKKIVFQESSNFNTLPDFGQIIIQKTKVFRSRDLKGEYFVDYGNKNAGLLPLASSQDSLSNIFPPFVRREPPSSSRRR